MKCLNCKEFYRVNGGTYFPYWCKLWKKWLALDKNNEPIKCKACKELGEDND